MPVTLTIENETNLPDGGPLSYTITGKRGIDIGRDAYLDWALPDPTKTVSGKHCEIRYRDGGYWLHDVSRNGTFLNRSAARMQEPHRLRNGDRLEIGRYIIVVTMDGEEAGEGAFVASHAAPGQYWDSAGDAAPPISPKDLRPARDYKPVQADFREWAVDVPGATSPQPGYDPFSAPPPRHAAPEDLSWAQGAAAAPPPPEAYLPVPTPRRPPPASGGDDPWGMPAASPPPPTPAWGAPPPPPSPPAADAGWAPPPPAQPAGAAAAWGSAPAAPAADAGWAAPPPPPARAAPAPEAGDWGAPLPAPPSAPTIPPPPAAPAPAAAPADDNPWGRPTLTGEAGRRPASADAPAAPEPAMRSGPPADFVARLAKGAGVSPEVFGWRDPGDMAEEIGALLKLTAESVKQLLAGRAESKRIARTGSHTMIQAMDNNPLKFSPTAEDALRIMFSRPSSGYLDARRAFEGSFKDLKAHQVKTYSAMQHALRLLMEDLDPATIEKSAEGGGIGALLGGKKAKLWDLYVARWTTLTSPHEDGMVDAFMMFFAECYDRGGAKG